MARLSRACSCLPYWGLGTLPSQPFCFRTREPTAILSDRGAFLEGLPLGIRCGATLFPAKGSIGFAASLLGGTVFFSASATLSTLYLLLFPLEKTLIGLLGFEGSKG